MYHFSGMPLKLTMAPSICKPRLTLAIAFADSTDGLTDATSNSGRPAGVWLKTAKQLRAARREPRIVCILHFTIRPLEKIHESHSPERLQRQERRVVGQALSPAKFDRSPRSPKR